MRYEGCDDVNKVIEEKFSFLLNYGFSWPAKVYKQENNMYSSLTAQRENNFGIEFYYEFFPKYDFLTMYIVKLNNELIPFNKRRLILSDYLFRYCNIQTPIFREKKKGKQKKEDSISTEELISTNITERAAFLKKYMPEILKNRERFLSDMV